MTLMILVILGLVWHTSGLYRRINWEIHDLDCPPNVSIRLTAGVLRVKRMSEKKTVYDAVPQCDKRSRKRNDSIGTLQHIAACGNVICFVAPIVSARRFGCHRSAVHFFIKGFSYKTG
jgi:hypothetical protein